MSAHSNASGRVEDSKSQEADLADLWIAIALNRKRLIVLTGLLIISGWALSTVLVDNKYSIESVVSLSKAAEPAVSVEYVVELLENSILPNLAKSADEDEAKYFKKIKIHSVKLNQIITLKSRALKSDIEGFKMSHDLVNRALFAELEDLRTPTELGLIIRIESMESELEELKLPAHIIKKTRELHNMRSLEQELLDALSNESSRKQVDRQIRETIRLLSEAYQVYQAANRGLEAKLDSLSETKQKTENLNALAANLRDMSKLMERKNNLDKLLNTRINGLSQQIKNHSDRIEILDQLIKFEQTSLENKISSLEGVIREHNNARVIFRPQVIFTGEVSGRPVGLTKTKAYILTIPIAVLGAAILVIMLNIYSRVKDRQKKQ